MDSFPIVREVTNVFPMDLLDVPPYWDIDCAIDLELRAKSISIAPYDTNLDKLKEFKDKLQDMLSKGLFTLLFFHGVLMYFL